MSEYAQCEVLIIGAGITGLTLARELVGRGVGRIVVIEKEPAPGVHASGRNSGVLHAGIYYNPDSLKGRFCVEGNRQMKAFCRAKGLSLIESGKVIVTRDESECPRLEDLKRRADACGAGARLIDPRQLARLEPHAATHRLALHSPETAVVNPLEILHALREELLASGRVRLECNCAFLESGGDGKARTSRGTIGYSFLVNAAGGHADVIARKFGLAKEYRSLPFKGIYREVTGARSFLVRGSIYPVPDPRNPFLGVHFTRGADGAVTIGPTAIPAFHREDYNLRWPRLGKESPGIVMRDAVLLFANAGFRSAALTEPMMYLDRFVLAAARQLVPDLGRGDLVPSSKVGVRAQLVHWPSRSLVMDFVVIEDRRAVHVLNAISPGFTSSMAFARHLAARILPL